MNSLFLDTNVLIDFLADRAPFAMDAARLFQLARSKKIRIYISAVSFNNIYYIIRRSHSHRDTMNMLVQLSDWTTIVDVSKNAMIQSLPSDFKDFEDAIQYHCACSVNGVDGIVIRNTKDYKKSTLPVFTPAEAIAFLDR